MEKLKYISLFFVFFVITMNAYSQKRDCFGASSNLSGDKIIYTDSMNVNGLIVYTDSVRVVDSFVSDNFEDIQTWSHEKMVQGYVVTLKYNKEKKEYFAMVRRKKN
jgi:hypothetical protein